MRGWGRFDIVDLEEEVGEGTFRFYNSALALQSGPGENRICLWVPGAMAGGVQVILHQSGSHLEVRGFEKQCLSEGNPHCEIVVRPVRP